MKSMQGRDYDTNVFSFTQLRYEIARLSKKVNYDPTAFLKHNIQATEKMSRFHAFLRCF